MKHAQDQFEDALDRFEDALDRFGDALDRFENQLHYNIFLNLEFVIDNWINKDFFNPVRELIKSWDID